MDRSTVLNGKRLLITGGTGSLGKTLLALALSGRYGAPDRITIFSRDEAKQHHLRVALQQRAHATHDIAYADDAGIVEFRVGDVRSLDSLMPALRKADIVVNAAALKQVPSCEYFPTEAVATNVDGATNIVRAIRNHELPVETVVGISTDKAVKPVNVMGMSKALQERIFVSGNLDAPHTRFVIVRYGNVLASRGSVIPLFHQQIRDGGPVTLTSLEMTRFLLSLADAVEIVMSAIAEANPGEVFVPRLPSARIADIADILIGDRRIAKRTIGIRPGEKVHEILVSEEEQGRASMRGDHLAIAPMLPELRIGGTVGSGAPGLDGEYSSRSETIGREAVRRLLAARGLLNIDRSDAASVSEMLA
ncbi:MAG: polysaccharide biosynthesis protein [Azospirillaceae bacterium]